MNCPKGVGILTRWTFALLLPLAASAASAQLLATTARQGSSGSLKMLAWYEGVSGQPVNFSVNSTAGCATPNGVGFGCGGAGKVEGEGKGSAGMVKLVWQPYERFQYYAVFGAGDYDLRVPSTTVANVLSGDGRGQIYGVGFRASVVPDTVVTPAITLDASVTRSLYDFNRVFPGGTPGVSGNIDQRLELLSYQFAVESSRLFTVEDWKLEPYGGIKWTRVQADLKDLVDGSHAGGKTDTVTPFAGLRVPVGEHEALFAEGSFLDGSRYGAGLELRFR